MSDTTPTTTTGAGKRELIVAAAVRCFAQAGVAATTMAAVAQDAGIGKGTVYEYFASKEELLLAAAWWCCDHTAAEIRAAFGGGATGLTPGNLAAVIAGGDCARMLRQVLVTSLQVVPTANARYQRIMSDLWVLAARDPAVQAQAHDHFRVLYREWESGLTLLYSVGMGQGVFKPVPDPALLSRMLTMMVAGYEYQQTFRDDRQPDTVSAAIADTWLRLVLK